MSDEIMEVVYDFMRMKAAFKEMREAGPNGKNLDPKLSNLDLAILTLATKTVAARTKFDDSLGHEICMGIRHGIFGGNAADDATIERNLDKIADAIDGIVPGVE